MSICETWKYNIYSKNLTVRLIVYWTITSLPSCIHSFIYDPNQPLNHLSLHSGISIQFSFHFFFFRAISSFFLPFYEIYFMGVLYKSLICVRIISEIFLAYQSINFFSLQIMAIGNIEIQDRILTSKQEIKLESKAQRVYHTF